MSHVDSFTEDQRRAYRSLVDGHNVFLTGEAGTGKSYVLEEFIKHCRRDRKQVLVMAPTGIAALNLPGGTTIHRTLNIPASFCDPNEPLGLPLKVLMRAEVIIIDEISMCRIDLFERVVRMVIAAQSSSGTKQIVLVGDFFQLPPVVTPRDLEAMVACYPGNPDGYCFKSNFWKGLALEPHVLSTVHRTVEPAYIEALNQARTGDSTCATFFNRCAVTSREKAPQRALWLCTHNTHADNINARRLGALPGQSYVFKAVMSGKLGKGDMPTAEALPLKVGARVMAVKNHSQGLYLNGSLGTVVSIDPKKASVGVLFDDACGVITVEPNKWQVDKAVVVDSKDEDGNRLSRIKLEEVGSFRQLPLRLAWAVTIHKAQGQTIEGPVAVETHAFTSGQLYVGLSRSVRSENLTLYPRIEPRYLHARRDVIRFYDEISQGHYELQPSTATVPSVPPEVLAYMYETGCDLPTALMHFVTLGISSN